ncbi:MAG: hypothetical protein M3040_14750 [Bacteroidota bacterium]|nr:hypothetical protein [Bacteroidota bacterium]
MFISTKHLVNKYGINEEIARFFVDREPPVDNLYWRGKLLYLRPSLPGYLFIPLIVDLLFKVGVNKEALLSERFVGAMEQVGHISAREEIEEISMAEAIKECENTVKENAINRLWLEHVNDYFNCKEGNFFSKLTTPFRSLHRGDVFLFSLSTLSFPPHLFVKIAELWFALIGLSLLVDDAQDIESDRDAGDENAYLESGLDEDGLNRIAALVADSVKKISSVNPTMGNELRQQHRELAQQPYIVNLLKHSI